MPRPTESCSTPSARSGCDLVLVAKCSVFGIYRAPNIWDATPMDAVQRLLEVLQTLNLPAGLSGSEAVPDLQVDVSGRGLNGRVEGHALIDRPRALAIIAAHGNVGSGEAGDPIVVVVSDRIVQGARDQLRAAGLSWCDLRGHLYLTGNGLLVDTQFPGQAGVSGRPSGLNGQVAIATAVDLLLHGPDVSGVREIARRVGAAPSSVSVVLKSLRDEGLADKTTVDQSGLFWFAAESWKPQWTPVASYPSPVSEMLNPALHLGFHDTTGVGWALSGDLAAASLGAPMGVSGEAAPDLYLPTRQTHRLAVSILEPATTAGYKARLAVAPAAAVCERRFDVHHAHAKQWLVARPLFIALDLAQDPGRGQEILRAWTPEPGGTRVW